MHATSVHQGLVLTDVYPLLCAWHNSRHTSKVILTFKHMQFCLLLFQQLWWIGSDFLPHSVGFPCPNYGHHPCLQRCCEWPIPFMSLQEGLRKSLVIESLILFSPIRTCTANDRMTAIIASLVLSSLTFFRHFVAYTGIIFTECTRNSDCFLIHSVKTMYLHRHRNIGELFLQSD